MLHAGTTFLKLCVSQLCSGAGRSLVATPSAVWHIHPVPGAHTHMDFVWTATESALSLCSRKTAGGISQLPELGSYLILKGNVSQAQQIHYHLQRQRASCLFLLNNSQVSCQPSKDWGFFGDFGISNLVKPKKIHPSKKTKP